MTPITTILEDTPEYTVTRVEEPSMGRTIETTVYKTGSRQFNEQALHDRAADAISDLDTAEGLLTGGAAKWDNLNPAQRTAITLGLVRQNRALIRLLLGRLESPS